VILALLLYCTAAQQSPDEWFLRWPPPTTAVAYRTAQPPVIDGRTDDPVWTSAKWSEPFVDITGERSRAPWYATRMGMAWDDSALYIAAMMEEPHVWATLQQRDTVIFQNNDFEVFIDPDGDNHQYVEFEVNALNTVWDLKLEQPYRDGGRGNTKWNAEGLRTAVHIRGTMNEPADIDTSWSVEFAIPWKVFEDLTAAHVPPLPGNVWRVNFARVEWPVEIVGGSYRKPAKGEENWTWSPQGIVNMHQPERWGTVEFLEEGMTPEHPDVAMENARRAVMEVYHAQKQFFRMHRRWAYDTQELNAALSRPLNAFVRIEITEEGFVAILPLGSEPESDAVIVRQDSKISPSQLP